MKFSFYLLILFFTTLTFRVNGQVEKKDFEKVLDLKEVTIEQRRSIIHTERLPDVHNTFITAGKKNEVVGKHIGLEDQSGNKAETYQLGRLWRAEQCDV